MSAFLYIIPAVFWLLSVAFLIYSFLGSCVALFKFKQSNREDLIPKVSWLSVVLHCFALPIAMVSSMIYRIMQGFVEINSDMAQMFDFIFVVSGIIFIVIWILSITVIIIHLSIATKQEDSINGYR